MTRLAVLALLSGLVFLALLGAVLFGCAGRTDLPWFWAYLGVWAVATIVATPLVDPGLIRERIRPGPGGQDSAIVYAVVPLWLGQYIVAGLDVGRFHWSDAVPPAVRVVAFVMMVAATVVLIWAEVVNPFFSTVIRIQTERGHHVITSGPYRFLRHPGYAALPFLFAGGGLVLGSWLAALIGLVICLQMLHRTAREDRILREQLEGYAAYAQKVRYRLFPGVW